VKYASPIITDLYILNLNRPTLIRWRLSLTHAGLGETLPWGW